MRVVSRVAASNIAQDAAVLGKPWEFGFLSFKPAQRASESGAMGHTNTNHLYHGVFATKERRPFISPEMVPELANVIGGIIRKRKGRLLVFNAMPEHVHLLAMYPPTVLPCDMYKNIKCISCDWVHAKFPDLKTFRWQAGYSSFTIGSATLEQVSAYILRQQVHHRRKTFEEELIEMLDRAGVEYDPKHIFD